MKAVMASVRREFGPPTSLPLARIAPFIKSEFEGNLSPDYRFDLFDWFTRWAARGDYESLYIPSLKLRFELLGDVISCVSVASALALDPSRSEEMANWIDRALVIATNEGRLIRYVLSERARIFARIGAKEKVSESLAKLIEIGPSGGEDDVKLPVDLIRHPIHEMVDPNLLLDYKTMLKSQHGEY